jgi:hypothetical protein
MRAVFIQSLTEVLRKENSTTKKRPWPPESYTLGLDCEKENTHKLCKIKYLHMSKNVNADENLLMSAANSLLEFAAEQSIHSKQLQEAQIRPLLVCNNFSGKCGLSFTISAETFQQLSPVYKSMLQYLGFVFSKFGKSRLIFISVESILEKRVFSRVVVKGMRHKLSLKSSAQISECVVSPDQLTIISTAKNPSYSCQSKLLNKLIKVPRLVQINCKVCILFPLDLIYAQVQS